MRIKYLILFVVVFGVALFAQEPAPESFFPHAVGNRWEYKDYWNGNYYNHYVSQIFKDSLLPDNSILLYYSLNNNTPSYKIDTNFNVFGIPTIRYIKEYELSADSGDYWVREYSNDSLLIDPYMVCRVDNIYLTYLFGKGRQVKEIGKYYQYEPDTLLFDWCIETHYLVEGIGLFRIDDWEGAYTEILVGCVIDGDTMGILSNIEIENEDGIPNKYELYQNYPNPFNPATIIRYSIPRATFAKITVYNILGQEVEKLFDGFSLPGTYEIEFRGDNLPSGVYLYQLETSKYNKTKKMLLVK